MSTIAQIICQPTISNEKKLKKLAEPLAQGFGLDIFWHYSLNSDGALSYIGSHPHLAEFFYSQRLYNGHPYFKDPKLLKSGFFFSDKSDEKDYVQTQGKLCDCHQLFVIMNVSKGKAEGYGFATTKILPDLSNNIINNLYLFKKFISYFESEASDLLKHMQKSSVDIANACGENFYKPTHYFDSLSTANQEAFYKQLDPQLFARLSSLSLREKECLKWFLKGLSAVQIGKKVHLSNRTVEFYLENIKNKIGCRTKQELFETLLCSSDFLQLTFF